MPEINPIRLSELNAKINNVIETAFNSQSFWVIADITNHTFRPQKNYHNFELVEKDPHSNNIIAKVSGKAWGNGTTRIKNFEQVTGQKFTNNINVLVQVKVTFHSVYGLSLEVIEIDTNFTLGVLEQQRQATLEKLVAENDFIQKVGDSYFTRNNQLKLPSVIQHIAVISSKTSAGGEDFKHTLQNNPFGYLFFIDDYYTVVQGESNAEQFLSKLIEVFQSHKPYDAVIITRGGGAQTDFLIFDNYNIGRAVAKFPIPIITGIGHQKNETIADLMAHTQTKTPTKAAEFIIAHNKAFEDAIISFQKTILIKSQQLFSIHFQSLSALNSTIVNNTRDILNNYKDSLVQINQVTINTSKSILFNKKNDLVSISSQILSKPKIILYNRINDIKNTIGNIKTFNSMYLKNQRGYLGHYVSIIKMMAPDNILKKGFAIVKANNKITSNPDDIKVGSDIDIILAETQIKSTVKQKSKYDGTEFNL
ncbi:MAG: exodeoxyribonuclease VII large subunit [Chitinophagaceae bacterium]|nr:exodeoxyribonuclease VII large subunit [Chitinophagaceae bacterium]